MRRCPSCQSIWVCWNWIDLEEEKGHECHNCSHTFTTKTWVDDGVPYNTLIEFGHFFTEPGLFEKNFKRDMELMEQAFNAEN